MVARLRHFLKTSVKAIKCLQNPLMKPKIESGSRKSKGYHFAHYYSNIIERPTRHICLSFRCGNNHSSNFSIKKFELYGNQFKLQKLSNSIIAKFSTSIRTVKTLQTNMKSLRAITMYGAFTPICRYDKNNFKLSGNVYFPKTVCLHLLCATKRFLNLLAEVIINDLISHLRSGAH